jgi:alanine transaminase
MTLSICPNTLGQIMLDMAVNPPTLVESGEVAIQFYSQKTDILNLMKKKAAKATELFNDMKNIKTQPIEGAMYCFPRIKLSDKAIEEANRRGVQPDLMYTLEVLENTGLMLVEGSGFGQKEGTYHFRTTILVNPEEKFQEKLLSFKKFNDEFHDRF